MLQQAVLHEMTNKDNWRYIGDDFAKQMQSYFPTPIDIDEPDEDEEESEGESD